MVASALIRLKKTTGITINRWPVLLDHYRLGNLYEWADMLRSVNMAKEDFHFAAANQLSKLVEVFEKDYLFKIALLTEMSDESVIRYMEETHVEFILIHPFRECNGCISRLLNDVTAVKAGFKPLDYKLGR